MLGWINSLARAGRPALPLGGVQRRPAGDHRSLHPAGGHARRGPTAAPWPSSGPTRSTSANGIWELREFTFGAGGMLVPDTDQADARIGRRSIARRCWRASSTPTRRASCWSGTTSRSTIRDGGMRPAVPGGGGVQRPQLVERAGDHQPRGPAQVRAQHLQRLPLGAGDQHRLPDGLPAGSPGQEARLSPFLTGTTTFDPITGPRVLNDLRRRNVDMHQFACPGEPLPEPPPAARTAGAPDGADAGRRRPPPAIRPRRPAMPAPAAAADHGRPPAPVPGCPAGRTAPRHRRRALDPRPRPECPRCHAGSVTRAFSSGQAVMH